MAALAEDRKVDKYRGLPRSHLFCPLSNETMGAMGPRSLELVREDRDGDRGATVY